MSNGTMTRRKFISRGITGLATGAVLGSLRSRSAYGQGGAFTVNLSFEEAIVEMIDFTPVYHWLFRLGNAREPSFPGPLIFATAGDPITFVLRNNLNEPHAFEVLRIPGSASGPIPPGGTRAVTFTALAAGTFLYLDPLNAPVNRVMGLHGALVILPRAVRENTPNNTPYTVPTPNVKRLFDDLGHTDHFPGDPWIPVRPATEPPDPDLPRGIEPFLFRTRVWVFQQVDPFVNARVQALGPGRVFDPAVFERVFLPRFFLINGQSGAFAAHDHASVLEGNIGEPHVVRQLNAGLATPSNHLHANHFYVLAINNEVQENVVSIDSMTLAPVSNPGTGLLSTGGSTLDWLVPFIRPPDIPGDPDTPLEELIPQEMSLVLGGVPQTPLKYPMHDHMEQSQTVAGGNYPQGDVTDIVFVGDITRGEMFAGARGRSRRPLRVSRVDKPGQQPR